MFEYRDFQVEGIMMLTLTPKTFAAGRTAHDGRLSGGVVVSAIGIYGGGITVILGDNLQENTTDETQQDARRNNKCHFYRYDAAATDASKPQGWADDHSGHSGQHHRAQAAGLRC